MSIFRQNHKKGLSLVTVLLFMLVATLAATGVFKWLSTQNKASASRLMQSEVYQASQAGIETARSWMTYHASDVGALVKQYKDNNRKPILMDSILHPLVSDKSQKFSVYLVGVDTKSYPYKLKLISTGTARSGSKYSQVAILSVDGLYQVEIPTKKTSLDFSYSFWGGSLDFGGGNTISSLVLNGDWSGNPPLITGDFIVTGTIALSGDNAQVAGNTCVGKNLNTNNATGPLKDVYVHQDFLNAQGTYQNVYVNGNLTQSNKKMQINGSLNINGTLKTNLGAQEFEVMGDLVLGSAGVLDFDSENRPFTVHKNVWIPNSNGITGAGSNYKHLLGMDLGATLQVAGVTDQGIEGSYKKYQSSSNTTFKSISSNLGVSGTPPTGAESVKNYCDDIWSEETGCGGSEFLIEDKLITAINSFKNKAVTTSTCTNLKTNFSDGNQMVTSLNDCYADLDENQPDLLYNGFLVVRLTSNNLAEFSEFLKGKFIFILESPLGQQRLPAMTDSSAVMLYLSQGSGQIMPAQCNTSSFYNYFIYSLKDITEINGFDSNCPITGTVYLPVKDPDTGNLLCMGTTKTQGNTKLEFNQYLLDALSTANIICPNDGSVCGSPTSGTPGSSSSSISSNGLDAYFIAVSPRLKTTLETQYVNKELDPDTLSVSSYSLLNPSILVMPRAIYLPTNAKGSLNQYYSVLNLNGAKENPNSGSVSCSPIGLNTSGDLTGSKANVYTCTYSPGNSSYNGCPFYVVVEGTLEQNPAVSLSLTSDLIVASKPEVSEGESHSVYLIVAPGSDPIGLGVQIQNSSGWSFAASEVGGDISGVSEDSPNLYYFTFNAPSIVKGIKLFDVTAGSTGSIVFELVTPVKGATFNNRTAYISVEGTAKVERNLLSTYLSKYPESSDKDLLNKWNNYPDCADSSSVSWVTPTTHCSSDILNKSWTCSVTGNFISFKEDQLVDGCTLIIPKENNDVLLEADTDSTYILYAGLKRNPYHLILKTDGASSNVNIHIKDLSSSIPEEYSSVTPGDLKTIEVFHGITYELTATSSNANDHLNYWKCKTASGANCAIPSLGDPTYTISPSADNDTLIIYFNQRNNCFNESFQGLQEDCTPSETVRCIDECVSGTACSVNGGVYPNISDWMMVYANSNNDFEKLEIVDGSDQNAYAGFGDKPVFILKPVPAGYEGIYTAQIRAYPKNSIMSTQSLNTGLVFRSNATGTSYFTLSVLSKKKDNTDLLRVCYATQASIPNESQCITKGDASSTWSGSSLDNVETYTVKAILRGDSLIVSVVDGAGDVYIPETYFNLADPIFGATGLSESLNEYVGFKLYGDHFRFYSLSWVSVTYICIDEPEFYCSFKANYAGGRIPANTDVTPWAYVSNYCNIGEACCSYYYIPTAPMQFGPGIYPESTVNVWASCERGGDVRDFDTIPCGAFFVGDRSSCTEDIWITSAQSCYGYVNCEISLNETSNLREAVLNFDLTLNGGADTISVYFIDVNGIQSQAGGYMMTSGSYSLPVLDFIDVDMFNPERITKVIFKSANELSFDVKNLRSSCPNSLQLNSCGISYDGSKLIFNANVSNASNCSISGPSVSEAGISCDGSWIYNQSIDLSSYAGQILSWTITAYNLYDNTKTETCSDTVLITAPSGTCSWSPTTLTATSTGSAQFTANFTDCPTLGCTYEIKDHNNIVVATGTGTMGIATFNTPEAANNYTYTAIVNGNTICHADLTVMAGTPPTASCGGVTSAGTFTATVSDPDGVGWSYNVIVTDHIGNTLHTSPLSATTIGAGNISYSGYSPSVAGTYYYRLNLNGIEVCASTLTIVGSITNCSLTPTTINPSEYVTFSATTDKVADGTPCAIKNDGGTDYTSGSPTINSNQCSSTFYPTQSGTYSVYINGYSRSCGSVTINVSSSSVVASSSSVGTVINIGYNSYVLFTSGTYQLSLIPNGSVFRCTIGASVNYDRTVATFNGTGLTIPAWQTQGTISTSVTSATFTVNPGYTLQCSKDW